MNDKIETQKICPSCHQPNKGDDNYCRYCGANLVGIESAKLEKAPVLVASETNKVEIIKNYKASKYGSICGVLLIPLILISLTILSQSINPIAFIALLVLFIFTIPIWICGLIQILRMTSGYGQTREFSVSDQEIKINIPNRFTFQINWSQFDSVEVIKSLGRDFGILMYSSLTDYYHFHFLSKNLSLGNFVIETGVDFSKSDVKKINSLVQQYAKKFNKEYRWSTEGLGSIIKGKPKILTQSTPPIQTIPEMSSKMPSSQSQQIDPSLICPYCGNTDPKQKLFNPIRAIGIYCVVLVIFALFSGWTYISSGYPSAIMLLLLPLICIFLYYLGTYNKVKCFQCKNEYKVKRKPQNI